MSANFNKTVSRYDSLQHVDSKDKKLDKGMSDELADDDDESDSGECSSVNSPVEEGEWPV